VSVWVAVIKQNWKQKKKKKKNTKTETKNTTNKKKISEEEEKFLKDLQASMEELAHGNIPEELSKIMKEMETKGFPDFDKAFENLNIGELIKDQDLQNFSAQGKSNLDGKGGEEMMNDVMKNFASKDLLYEPLVSLREMYPKWLSDHKNKIDKKELDKYEQQFEIIKELCQLYEKNGDQSTKIIELMQKMNELGSPPPEIIKELAGEDVELNDQGLPKLFPDACTII